MRAREGTGRGATATGGGGTAVVCSGSAYRSRSSAPRAIGSAAERAGQGCGPPSFLPAPAPAGHDAARYHHAGHIARPRPTGCRLVRIRRIRSHVDDQHGRSPLDVARSPPDCWNDPSHGNQKANMSRVAHRRARCSDRVVRQHGSLQRAFDPERPRDRWRWCRRRTPSGRPDVRTGTRPSATSTDPYRCRSRAAHAALQRTRRAMVHEIRCGRVASEQRGVEQQTATSVRAVLDVIRVAGAAGRCGAGGATPGPRSR